ncbi:hypothetical protein OESDEN_08190, partial [Oesophagostomum dentatum]
SHVITRIAMGAVISQLGFNQAFLLALIGIVAMLGLTVLAVSGDPRDNQQDFAIPLIRRRFLKLLERELPMCVYDGTMDFQEAMRRMTETVKNLIAEADERHRRAVRSNAVEDRE